MKKSDIITQIKQADLPFGQYWVCAGSGLVLHGVREETNDIDMGCTPALFAELRKRSGWVYSTERFEKLTYHDVFEVMQENRVSKIIDIEGVSVASLADIRKEKENLGREKDKRDIRLMDEFAAQRHITIRRLQEYVKHKTAASEANEFLFYKLVEEVGEVSRAISNKLPRATEENIKNTLEEEICDVLFYTLAIANLYDIDIEKWIPMKEMRTDEKYRTDFFRKYFLG